MATAEAEKTQSSRSPWTKKWCARARPSRATQPHRARGYTSRLRRGCFGALRLGALCR